MLTVERKKFNSIEFQGNEGAVVRIDEGMVVEAVLEETGEIVLGTMTKITAKELFIHVGDEDFNRVFTHDALVSIKEYVEEEEE